MTRHLTDKMQWLARALSGSTGRELLADIPQQCIDDLMRALSQPVTDKPRIQVPAYTVRADS